MINCPRCRHDNVAGSRACGVCGLPLVDPVEDLGVPAVPDTDLTLLVLRPGELLCDRRYQVLEVLASSASGNTYAALDLSRRVCPDCGTPEAPAEARTCPACSGTFGGRPAEAPECRLLESLGADGCAGPLRIADLGVHHPGLDPVRDRCTFAPYAGLQRHFVVMEAESGTRLDAMARPVEVGAAIGWARQIGDALGFLHGHGLAHNAVSPGNVRLVAGRAVLTGYDAVDGLDAVGNGCSGRANDVAGLGALLQWLLVGSATVAPVSAIVARAVGAGPGEPYRDVAAMVGDLDALAATARSPGGPALRIVFGCASSTGRVRDLNEDSLVTLVWERSAPPQYRTIGLFAVADGMGGHAAGEVASRLVVDALASEALQSIVIPAVAGTLPLDADGADLLRLTCQASGRALQTARERQASNMGATLVAVLVTDAEAHVAHVGDSRAYRLGRDGLVQITTDHSLVQRWVELGQLSPEAARTHPRRNLIYRQVGDQSDMEVDLSTVRLDPGDWLLLCSDGLNGMLADGEIAAVLASGRAPQDACDELVRLANQAGGDDNITVVAVRADAVAAG